MPAVCIVVPHPAIDHSCQRGEALGVEEQRAPFLFEAAEKRFHLRVVFEPPQGVRQPHTILQEQLPGPGVADESRTLIVVEDQVLVRDVQLTKGLLGSFPSPQRCGCIRSLARRPTVGYLAHVADEGDQVVFENLTNWPCLNPCLLGRQKT